MSGRFLTDLRRTFAAWGAQPMLPLTVLAVAARASYQVVWF